MSLPILSFLLLLPLLGMTALVFAPEKVRITRIFATSTAAITFLLSLVVAFRFDSQAKGFQFTEHHAWIPSIGAQFLLGIDGISLLLVLLTTLITLIAIISSFSSVRERSRLFYGMILLLETGILGVFTSLDLFLFYLFWDLVLIPMYFIIGIYGGARRSYAAIKFFLFTLLGSVFLLLGFIALYFQYWQQTGTYTFDLQRLITAGSHFTAQPWIFWALFFGFAV
jgi:NADH-quinone oxidoreductase subunit M